MDKNTQTELEEASPGHPGLSLLSILRTVWKRKIRIAAVWILFTVVAVAVVRFLPTVYLAESVVLIDSQKIPEKFVSATVASDLDDRIAAIRQMLLSGGQLKKIIDEFGLYQEQRKTHFEEEILEMMRNDISIKVEAVGNGSAKRPGAFRIGYQGADPMVVMRVANRLTDLYVEQNLKTREAEASGTSEFLDTQLVEAKKRLDELEAAVSRYKLQHNGELPEQEASLTGTLSRLQTELEANRDAINRAQQTRVILEGTLGAMEATLSAQTRSWEQAQEGNGNSSVVGDPAGTKKKASEVLQEQLDLLTARYSDQHPDIIALRSNIEKLKLAEKRQASAKAEDAEKATNLAENAGPTQAVASEPVALSQMRQQIAQLKARIKASDKELEEGKADQERILHAIDQYQQRVERLPVREQEMAQVTRDYEISKENYKSLLDKKMAASMALDMERRQQSERFILLDRAQMPEKPIKPKRPLLYGAGALLGLAFGLLLGFTAELRQNVILGEWELPEDTPVLARLPRIEVSVCSGKTTTRNRRGLFGRKKRLVSAPATSLILIGIAMAGWSFHLF